MIFHDATLLNIAGAEPATEAELLAVSGVGEQKAKKYGRAVLTVIVDWKAEQQAKKSARTKGKKEHSARRGPYGLQRIYERKKQEDLTGTQLSLKCD